jgi:putative glutamine amidotransferase
MLNMPRIGVTGPDEGGAAAWVFTAFAILISGGWPVRIRPSQPREIEGLNGLVVGGGADVDPRTYANKQFLREYIGKPLKNKKQPFLKRLRRFLRRLSYPFIYLIRRLLRHRNDYHIDTIRDSLEFNIVDQAVKKGMPILGICRGMQLVNVYFQGSLHKEIRSFYQEEINRHSILPVKKITVERGSKLFKILKMRELRVNALHHQAVNSPGEGIAIAAKEENGVVQAIESNTYPFFIGVQWHPEYLTGKRAQRRLFKSLVKEARAFRKKKVN